MTFKREQGCFELFLNSYKPQWGKKCCLHHLSMSPQTTKLITILRSLILERQVFFRAFSNVLDFRKQREQKKQESCAVFSTDDSQSSSVQSLSRVQLFATPWSTALQVSLSITNCQSPPKPMSIESVVPSSHLILCRPLLLPSIRVFSNEPALPIRWPKYWSFSFSISPSNEHPGLISFRVDWLDLPAVQGTLKPLLQHHSSKASILQHSAFFIVQLSHPYMTTGKTIALTRQTFVDKVMSLLLNMLSRLVITFLLSYRWQ